MSALHQPVVRHRHVIDLTLALTVFALAAVWFMELSLLLDHAAILWYVFLPGSLIIPGLLAISVLIGVGAFGVRVFLSVRDTNGTLSDGRLAIRVLGSAILGVVGLYTLWWAAGSIYAIYFGNPGLLLHPYVVLGIGVVLGVLVLCRTVFNQLALAT